MTVAMVYINDNVYERAIRSRATVRPALIENRSTPSDQSEFRLRHDHGMFNLILQSGDVGFHSFSDVRKKKNKKNKQTQTLAPPLIQTSTCVSSDEFERKHEKKWRVNKIRTPPLPPPRYSLDNGFLNINDKTNSRAFL